VPVVAAINGSSLGLGFEMALACHYRIAVDSNRIKLGNPEIELGLMPGGGASIRLLWMLGIENAYHALTIQKKFNPREALERNFPAHLSILNTLAAGIKLDFDTACKIESQHFSELVMKQDTKNMMKTFWFDLNKVKGGEMRPKGFGKFRARKVGIIGAGIMGTGIALSCLLHGVEVVMKDVSEAVAQKGKDEVHSKLDTMVSTSRISKALAEKAKSNFVSTEALCRWLFFFWNQYGIDSNF